MKQKILTLLAGIVLGAALFGGASAVAAGITAQPSWSPIYVDGKQVQMTAYNILGSNFVKLRDIGQAVGFNVYYQNGVQVDSNTPYTGEAPASDASQTAVSPTGTLQISSMKGTELTVGERSLLLISPARPDCSAASSDSAVASLEQVAGYWVIVPQSPGTTTVTITDHAGESGSLTFAVKTDTSASATLDLNANMDIRQEMIRLINQVRLENGKQELSVNEALMNAAQDVSSQCVKEHRPYDHKALARYGWPYGALYNLTVFTAYGCPDIAKQAITYWLESPGHYETMLSEGSHVGTGVTFKNGRAYCYMVVGDPDSCNPYT